MKGEIKTLLTFGGLFGLIWLISQKIGLQKLQATVNNITFLNGKLVVIIRIANPSNVAVKINNILGEILINGTSVASVNNFDQQTIAANGFSDVKVYLTLNFLGTGQYFYSLMDSYMRKNLNATFNGVIKANNISIPVTKTMKLL
jgi:LEA14-like dessication related protein